jgi:hypothetical protein
MQDAKGDPVITRDLTAPWTFRGGSEPKQALQAQIPENLRLASKVMKRSSMSRDQCTRKNNGLCSF